MFTSKKRSQLFLEMASVPGGTTAADVFKKAVAAGDTVTQEAYYNLARRLSHRGLLKPDGSTGATRFIIGADSDSQWLEEEDLVSIIDPEYPLLALPVWAESKRHTDEIPEELWAELREHLSTKLAPELFCRALQSYSDDLHAQVDDLVRVSDEGHLDLARLKREADNSRRLLERMAKFGLGLSKEAIHVPLSIELAIAERRQGKYPNSYFDRQVLQEEIDRRVAPEPFVVDEAPDRPAKPLMIGAVDGSTRGGMLSFLGSSGDLTIGHAPMFSINTAVGQVNRTLTVGERSQPVFMRLPERPEDMQRQDNRYSIMAKLFFPDLSDAEYMHSVWNAMDLMEARTALRLLNRWDTAEGKVEVPPSDVVLRDGTVSPQDRDFRHYRGGSSYERIVKDAIETNWKIASKCSADQQTVAGVVKSAQLSVFAPVVNWFAGQLARDRVGRIAAWPLNAMNLTSDQMILTRLLTARSGKAKAWKRTCVVLRPFHAVTNFAQTYERSNPPSAQILASYEEATTNPSRFRPDERAFWETFRPESDPYLKMLDGLWYANIFVGAVPRLDLENQLPRVEFLVPASTADIAPPPWPIVAGHRSRLLAALKETQFQVASEHDMFRDVPKIDVLPLPIIRVHDTVKLWATELLSRVQEFLSFYLARHVKSKQFRGVKVRPFTRAELELLYEQLRRERDRLSGGAPQNQLPD